MNGHAGVRLILSGCSGGGKSTLLAEMSRRGYVTVPEAGRLVVKEQLARNGNALPWKHTEYFCKLCLSKIRQQYDSVREIASPVIFDRSAVDILTELYHKTGSQTVDNNPVLPDSQFFSTVVFTPPWRAIYCQDKERRHSFDQASDEYQRLLDSYPKYGFTIKELPKTSVTKRADCLESILLDAKGY